MFYFGHYEKALKYERTWKWSVTSVPADTDGSGPSELRACLTEGWEPFAVDSGRIYLRRKIST
jgi:hypothetical protein